jgi:hypothetical protein
MQKSETIQTTENSVDWRSYFAGWRSNRVFRAVALYSAMVVVSTIAIFFLEHATLVNAIRTALVAAIGKSVAASWVVQMFD